MSSISDILGDICEEEEEKERVSKHFKIAKHSISGNKLPKFVSFVLLENIFFHSEENVIKWKFVFHCNIFAEYELVKNAQECAEIMQLLSDAQLIKIVIGISPYYPKLVKEFVMDLPTSINKPDSHDFSKVQVRGSCFDFSLAIINDYLGRGWLINADYCV